MRDANKQIETAFKNGETPILVGGTSFYFVSSYKISYELNLY
jgi:tRNA A37 N6-isopentenylltransferase MiaA